MEMNPVLGVNGSPPTWSADSSREDFSLSDQGRVIN